MEKQDFVRHITVRNQEYDILDINMIEEKGIADVKKLPFSIKILVENLLRKLDGHVVRDSDLINISRWQKKYDTAVEIPHHPARVLMQDFTGVPAVVDLAAMRDAVSKLGGDPEKINPLIPVELVVDHSVQLDYYGTTSALKKNVAMEYKRNEERYALLKWAQRSFDNFKVVPPNSGICHQVNLEYLARVVATQEADGRLTAYPDSLVGTDSHTTMINGMGIMGWGVGGIEAEAVMLGQPYYMSVPEVIGVRLTGELREGVTATDLVLTLTEMLRKQNVVEKFVEYFGPGMKQLSLTDRATIANMSPEYGATMGFFPVDEKTIDYLRLTHRADQAELVEAYSKAVGLFYTGESEQEYTEVLELDISTVEPSLAGPARPQDRIPLSDMERYFTEAVLGCEYDRDADVTDISSFHDESGTISSRDETCQPGKRCLYRVNLNGRDTKIGDGSIVIAAITSCTNTSNPFVLMGAGLMAKKAVGKGLLVPPCVKTSLSPGSRVVLRYLEDAGLMPYFEALGFHLAGFGCTTCIGNSGPLHAEIEGAVLENDLTVVSVLSGNRNFEARIHQSIKGNFLASPMLVVAFALAGKIDTDLTADPIAIDPNNELVYLEDIWPASEEIEELVRKHVNPEFFKDEYEKIFEGDEFWQKLSIEESTTYQWDEASDYIKNPPYFEDFSLELAPPSDLEGARALLLLGDSLTTDHISPAGAIPQEYPAGKYLLEKDVAPENFNSYGSRRGNHEVMMRGTFGNIRIKNHLVMPKEGSFTIKHPEDEEMFIYDAAMQYRDQGTPLVVLGGKEYGTGSSRDWAAKGSNLLGVKAVIARSYERIHRSNLVGMGVLPLVFKEGDSWESLGLNGSETFSISGVADMKPMKTLQACAVKQDGSEVRFEVIARLNTDIDVAYFENGGILPYVLRKLMGDK